MVYLKWIFILLFQVIRERVDLNDVQQSHLSNHGNKQQTSVRYAHYGLS